VHLADSDKIEDERNKEKQ